MKRLFNRPLTMCFFCRTITESTKTYKYKGVICGKVCESCQKSPFRKIKALLLEPSRRFIDIKMKGILHS